jgi:hypothetical protein
VLVDDAVAGRVIFGDGQLEGRAVVERENALHGAFAEGFLAENHRAVQILQTAGDDFRRAGAAEIDQDDDRHAFQFIAVAPGAQDGIFGRVAAFGGDNQLPARQEFLADIHRLVEQAARIEAQIQNQRLHVPAPSAC